jgi:hypothetical protein
MKEVYELDVFQISSSKFQLTLSVKVQPLRHYGTKKRYEFKPLSKSEESISV